MATKKTSLTPKSFIVYDPCCGCDPQVLTATDELDAAKKFASANSEVLGDDLDRLHIIPVSNMPAFKFAKAVVTMTRVTTK